MRRMSRAWQAYLHVDLWDLAAAGVDAVLDRAAGELGVDGIRVTAVSGAVCRVGARPELQPRVWRCEAAAHFQPDARRYGDTRLRPPTAEWIKSRNPLASLVDACAKRNLKCRMRIVACDNATLAERHSHAACVDAFGVTSAARLCPSNADVRMYVRGLVDDLSMHYQPAGIDLVEADFGPPQAFHPGIQRPADPIDADSLSLCFCPSCCAAAAESGIDAGDLASHVVAAFDAGEVADRARIQAYAEFRAKIVGELLKTVRGNSESELWWECAGDGSQRGLPTPSFEACAAGLLSPFDQPAALHAQTARIGICYPVGIDREVEEGAPAVVRELSELTARGHQLFILENFAGLPRMREDWVRQAVRYARRLAGQ